MYGGEEGHSVPCHVWWGGGGDSIESVDLIGLHSPCQNNSMIVLVTGVYFILFFSPLVL